MKYELEDRPGPLALLLYGLQWWVIALPCVIILGVVVARMHFDSLGDQVFYLQKIFGLTGLAMLAQLFWGHRLPLVIGPAAILLVGLTASRASSLPALYTAIMIGGALMAIVAAFGLIDRLRVLFTARVVAVILILIAFTLTPTILRLVLDPAHGSGLSFVFALGLVLVMIMANQILPGVWKSMTVLIGLAGGSLAWATLTGGPGAVETVPARTAGLLLPALEFEAGAVISFLFCMAALAINELGSIESIGRMIGADDLKGRVRRGQMVQGLANLASGAAGIIGPVSFSLSAGVIAATGCAARRTMIPACLGLIICAFFPQVVLIFSRLPGVVMGAMLLYLMAAQLASGLTMLMAGQGVVDFGGALTVGLPLMVGLLAAFAPASALADWPALLKPIVGNGFIMGTVMVILLEHLILRPGRRSG